MTETELETTEQAWAALPKAKRVKLDWVQKDKSSWLATVEGETLPARITRLDAKTFATYRGAKYLGSEATLEAAQMRAVLGELSHKNRAMRAWEKEHPDEIPPFLLLTQAERAEYWRLHPPQAARASTGGRTVPPKAVGVQQVPQQYGTPEQKAAASKEFTKWQAEVDGGGKVVPSAEPKQARPSRTDRARDYKAEVRKMLLRGCTREDVLRVTGWTSVSIQQQAQQAGLVLTVDKSSKPFRYKAEENKK